MNPIPEGILEEEIRRLDILSWRHLESVLGLKRGPLRALASTAGRYYRPFEKGKKRRPFQKRSISKKVRLIDNPQNPLKAVQRQIQKKLLSSLTLPDHMMCGVSGKTIRDNIMIHLGAPLIVAVDIKSFFPNVTPRQIYAVWRDLLGCSPRISKVLTKLTTYRGKLPQGSSASTMLANLVLSFVDDKIRGECMARGVTYSTWLDDLAFSGRDAREIIPIAISVLGQAGFAVSHRKIRVMGSGDAKVLHNIVISRTPRVSGAYLSQIRSGIHKLESGAIPSKRNARYVRALRGRIRYVAAFKEKVGNVLESKLDAAVSQGASARGEQF